MSLKELRTFLQYFVIFSIVTFFGFALSRNDDSPSVFVDAIIAVSGGVIIGLFGIWHEHRRGRS